MSWFSRLKNALNPRRLDDELAEETRYHLDRRAGDLEQSGLDPSEARRQAARRFGNAASIRESSREFRLSTTIEGSLQDLRYALRGLRRSPAFACAAVASLGLAIGANTAIYSIVDAAVLRSLPVPQPDRLVLLASSEDADRETFSYPAYERLSAAAGDSARLAVFGAPNRVEAKASRAGDSPYEQVIQQFVSPNAFEALALTPALGSFFSPEDDRYPPSRAAAVLSYDYWQRRFAGDPSILGRSLLVDNRPVSVLGVAPRGFSGAEPGRFVDVWLSVKAADPGLFTNDVRLFHLLGRLAPGIGREQLGARLQPASRRIEALSGANGTGGVRRVFARPLWLLLAVSACMLLIAAANVASLLLARSVARGGELAVRVSLGAGRSRLLRQLLAEALLLSSTAGLLGWLLATVAAPVLVTMVSTRENPVQLALSLDGRVLLFCAAACAVSAIFFALLPAWQATHADPISALRHQDGHAGRLRVGRLFVGLQVAFAFCLVAVAASLLFSLRNLAVVDTGFDPRGVTVVSMVNTNQRDRQLPFLRQFQTRIAQLPQVQGAAAAWMAVFSGERRADRVVLPGKPPSPQEETFYRVSPGYFATLRTPLLAGRDFTPRDNDDEPVSTVVNLAFARKYFGEETVTGREFRRDDGVRHLIVGVAANSHFGSLRNGPEPIAYMPMKPPRAFTLYVRSTLDSLSVSKLAQREADALGLGLHVREVAPLDSLVGGTIRTERLLAGIAGALAFLGLLLAATGLFGILNYSVTRRTREFGIRAALGAQRPSLYGLVLQDLFGTIAAGLLGGTAGALTLTRSMQSLLYGVGPADPLAFTTAIAVFLAAALLAAAVPARRAANLDPVTALRRD